jgi:hypothetical protein
VRLWQVPRAPGRHPNEDSEGSGLLRARVGPEPREVQGRIETRGIQARGALRLALNRARFRLGVQRAGFRKLPHGPSAFSLITNRSCKPLRGRYYREHSDGVDRRFSRGRQGPRTPGDFDCFIPRCPRGFQTTKNCRSSWFRRSPGQPAATCASPEPDCWCRLLRPPLATASTSQTGSIGRRHNSRPQR